MSIAEESVDNLQAFMEKYQAGNYKEATQLYYTTPILPEVAVALGHFAHVVSVLLMTEEAKGIPNLTRVFAVTLYLIGYRAGEKSANAS